MMEQKKKSNENQATIEISDSMSIYEATRIHKELCQYIEECMTVYIDLGKVTFCDTAGIQLLFSAIKTGKENGKRIIISNISETIQETVGFIGAQQNILYGGCDVKNNYGS